MSVCVCVCESAIIVDTLMFCALIILLVPNYLRVSPIADPASLWLLRLWIHLLVALSVPGWYEIMIHVIAWCLNCYLINLITYCTYCLAHTHTQALIVHMWSLCLLLISCGFLSSYDEHCADYSHSVYVHNIFVWGHKFIYVVIHTYIPHIIRLETAAFSGSFHTTQVPNSIYEQL